MSETENTIVDLSGDTDRVQTGRLPRFNYLVRVVEEPVFKVSRSSGNPMLVFKIEVKDPSEVTVKDDTFKTAGITLTLYAAFTKDDETGHEINRQLGKIHKNCELPLNFVRCKDTGLPQTDEGTPIRYTGLEFWIQGDSEETIQKDDNDQPITHPITGAPLKGWAYNVRQIYVG